MFLRQGREVDCAQEFRNVLTRCASRFLCPLCSVLTSTLPVNQSVSQNPLTLSVPILSALLTIPFPFVLILLSLDLVRANQLPMIPCGRFQESEISKMWREVKDHTELELVQLKKKTALDARDEEHLLALQIDLLEIECRDLKIEMQGPDGDKYILLLTATKNELTETKKALNQLRSRTPSGTPL